jgi:enoyl-CoA hydratase
MTSLITNILPPLAQVTLNRPEKRNAINHAMWQGLLDLAQQLGAEPTVRVILLSGAGSEAFSAGADISEMQANLADPSRMKAMQDVVLESQMAWERIPVPTIALLRGACTGGGCGLALACDLRLATPDAFMAIPPAKLGLAYSLADAKRLYDLVGPSRAKEILYTGRRVSADEALQLGMINEIVPASELEARAQQLAHEIASNAGNSVRAAKTVIDMLSAGVHAETPDSRRYYEQSFDSAEFKEGARAFLEKRKPRF